MTLMGMKGIGQKKKWYVSLYIPNIKSNRAKICQFFIFKAIIFKIYFLVDKNSSHKILLLIDSALWRSIYYSHFGWRCSLRMDIKQIKTHANNASVTETSLAFLKIMRIPFAANNLIKLVRNPTNFALKTWSKKFTKSSLAQLVPVLNPHK